MCFIQGREEVSFVAELSRRSFLKGLAGAVVGLVIPDIWIPKKTEAADIEIYRGNVNSSQNPMDYYGEIPSHPYKVYPDDNYTPNGSYDYGTPMRNVHIEETYLGFYELENRMYTDQLVIHHIGGGSDRDVSAEEVHQWHINQGWSGIGYHFLIRKDGTIERGRPLDTVGSHVQGQNGHTIGINIAGNFCEALPTDAQIVSAAGLAADLCSIYRIRPSYDTIVGHCDLASTACPGNYLYERIPAICQMAADLV